jgi:glucose-1-phosphate cytidylyltransferase
MGAARVLRGVLPPAQEALMQVVILCGGQGTRIRDVADDVPKPMIPIGNRPILWHIMKGYARYGFNRFVLCLGYKSWVIKRYFLDYTLAQANFTVELSSATPYDIQTTDPPEDWHVTLVETGLDAMTGCRLKRVERYVTGEHFLLTYGDGVADVDIGQLVAFHLRHGKTGTVTAVRPPGRFGEIELAGRQVIEFNEKPVVGQGRINGGFFAFHRRIFDRLHEDPSLTFEQAPLTDLARSGELMAHLHDGFWQPMDTGRDYRYLNDLWADGRAPWDTWDVPRTEAA